MKKILSVILCVVLMVTALPLGAFNLTASALTEGYYTYTVSGGNATITAVDTAISGDIVIPSTLGGYEVTGIGGYAFAYCTALTNVTIPNRVTSIGDSAFMDCTSLTNVTIPNSVTSIGSLAFYYCTALTSVTIGSGVTVISSYAFCDCRGLTSITIPNSVTSIGDYAFYNCDGITSITIPSSVTSIGDRTFYGCTGLTSIDIPDGVTSIGECAFYKCTGLTSITIPNSVTSIGNWAFYGCTLLTGVYITDLKSWCEIEFEGNYSNPLYYAKTLYLNNELISGKVIIPAGVTSIPDYAFYKCTGLTGVTIPNSVTSIGDCAFWGCSGLTSVTIPNSVTSIGDSAFWGCSGLTDLTIPKSIIAIECYAFGLCSKLTNVYYYGTKIDKAKIDINANNEKLINAKWHYTSCENDMHTYDYVCSNICRNCEYTKVADTPHSYDNDCDEMCNVCSEQRTIKHIFTKNGENIAICKICKALKNYNFVITTDEAITLSYEASKEFDFVIGDTSIARITDVSSSIVSIGSYYRQVSSAKVLSIYPGETVVKIVAANGTVLTSSTLLVVEGKHQMQLSEVLNIVSCTEPGKELYTCKFCDYQEEKIIENLGHIYDNDCDTICNICDDERIITHSYKSEWDMDALEHWHECSICKNKIDVAQHDYANAADVECCVCGFCRYTPGDINDSGEVTLDDVVSLAQIVAGWQNVAYNEAALDVNGDGNITLDDVVLLAQYVAGWSVIIS